MHRCSTRCMKSGDCFLTDHADRTSPREFWSLPAELERTLTESSGAKAILLMGSSAFQLDFRTPDSDIDLLAVVDPGTPSHSMTVGTGPDRVTVDFSSEAELLEILSSTG